MQPHEHEPTASASRLLRPSEVENLTTLDRVTLWRKVNDGTFPRPLKISANRIAWRASDVSAWVDACAEAA